jgi:hypothetical protein
MCGVIELFVKSFHPPSLLLITYLKPIKLHYLFKNIFPVVFIVKDTKSNQKGYTIKQLEKSETFWKYKPVGKTIRN